MKLIKLHYAFIWISCMLCASIVVTEIIQDSLREGSFDFGYVEYLVPVILILAVTALYYSLFQWNRLQSSELFWVVVLLSLVIGAITTMYIVDAWEDIFPPPGKPTYLDHFLDGLFPSTPRAIKTTEKILFYLYGLYTLVLFSLLLLTILIRSKHKRETVV